MRFTRTRLPGRAAVWAVVGTGLLGPVPVAHAEGLAPRPAELRLAWVDLCRTPPDLRRAAEREVRALLEPVGIDLTARSATPGIDEPTGGALVILLPSDPAHGGTRHRSAGASRREPAEQVTVWAFPPNVARALGLQWEREAAWSLVERRLFARGLGAVVVHELAHVFAGAPDRPTGLMSGWLRPERVSDPRLALDADLHAAFRDGVASRGSVADSESRGPRTASRR